MATKIFMLLLCLSVFPAKAQENTQVELSAFYKGKPVKLTAQQKISVKQLPDSLVLTAITPAKGRFIIKYRMIFGEGSEPVIDNNPGDFDLAENRSVVKPDILQAVAQPNYHLAFDVWMVFKINESGKTIDTRFERMTYKIAFSE
jgi:hypothetical protein